jgi:NitT/TauT family transport system substrate-binding protein
VQRRSALLGLAAAALAPRALRSQTLTPLRLLGTPVDPCGALYYAKDAGFFERAGLDVEITTPPDYGIAISALVSGAADIVYAQIVQGEQAFKKGLTVVIIAPAAINDQRRPTNYLLVAKDSPIKTARDLNGQTLGSSPLKSVGTYATDAWVDAHGGDSSTYKWADIPFPLLGDALVRGRIQAAFSIEPFATQARAVTRLLGRPYELISPHFLGAAYFATSAWAAAHPDLVRRFAATMHEASVWGNRNHDKSALILEKYSKADAATMALTPRAFYAESLDAADIQPTIDFCAKYKMIDGGFAAKDLLYHAPA